MSSKQDNHDKSNTPKSKRTNKKKNQSDDDEPEIEEKFDNEQFQKMLASMFPSKHQTEKVNDIKKKKKNEPKKERKKRMKKKSIKKEESDEEEYKPDDDVPTTSDSEIDRLFEEELERQDDMDTEDEEEIENMRKGFRGMKFNIIFTDPRMGSGRNESDEETDSDYEPDEDDDEIIFNGYNKEEEEEEEEENIKMTKKEYELHKKEEAKSRKDPQFKKNERIFIKLDDWDKKYKGTIKRISTIRAKKPGNGRSHYYDVKLDESDCENEDYELVRKVPENKIKKIKQKEENKYQYDKLVNEMK